MFEPISISEASERMRRDELTPADLVERCLHQIETYEDRVQAWVLVDTEGARHQARLLGEETARGDYRGPLHGIPIGIKDIVDVEGFATRAGSPLRKDHVARRDAPIVAGLRRAGAIILGKTVTVEFACFDPSPTRNPWDPELRHTPGGSSSGSAAAVALGMCLGAIGTQTGGSLVRPSSYCGIAACKPTFGRVSSDCVVPVSHHLDHPGPMAQTVDDLEIMLDCLPPPDHFGWPTSLGDDAKKDLAEPSAPPRLGLVEEFFLTGADATIRQATLLAIEKLRSGGATIDTVSLPCDFEEVNAMHGRIMAVEAAAYHRRQFADHREAYGPMIAGLLDEGFTISGVDYAEALAHQRDFRRCVGAMVDGFDALVMPSTDTTAPATLLTTGNKHFQAPWSSAGVPVVSIPCGIATNRMPAALQFVQSHHRESQLFHTARWCETCLDFRDLPPWLAAE